MVEGINNLDLRVFNKENFALVVSEGNMSSTMQDILENKPFNYMHSYLSYNSAGFKASMMLIEPNYISEAYTGDFLSHYSRKFKIYPKFTTRIHFFDCVASEEEIFGYLANLEKTKEATKFWNGYIGYTVVKPITSSCFGATLFKAYDSKSVPLRSYNVTIDEVVHLLGRTLPLKGLGFQQQDMAVGACATNALWCAFHKTSRMFGTDLPSPHNITKSSSPEVSFIDVFDNDDLGLTAGHISQAIRSLGMRLKRIHSDVDLVGIDHHTLCKFIYGYCKTGIPVLLGYQQGDEILEDDFHLVTICGYRLDNNAPKSNPKNGFMEYSERICRLYAHDDLIGPYSKITFDRKDPAKFLSKNQSNGLNLPSKIDVLATHYIGGKPEYGGCVPNLLVVPLHETITVDLDEVRKSILNFHSFFVGMRDGFMSDPEWEIYLQSGVDYKDSFRGTPQSETVAKILSSSYPFYVWVGRLTLKGIHVLDIIYDATDDNNSFCCFQFNLLESAHHFKLRLYVEGLLANVGEVVSVPLTGKKSANEKPPLSRKHLNFMFLALKDVGMEMEYYGKPISADEAVKELLKNVVE